MGGTSIYTKISPSYANTFIGKLEEDFVYHTQPLLRKKYIDECFFIWTGMKDSLNIFLDYLK